MVRKLTILILVFAVVFISWTVSVVGILAETWAMMPPTPTPDDGAPSLTMNYDALPHLPLGYDLTHIADVS